MSEEPGGGGGGGGLAQPGLEEGELDFMDFSDSILPLDSGDISILHSVQKPSSLPLPGAGGVWLTPTKSPESELGFGEATAILKSLQLNPNAAVFTIPREKSPPPASAAAATAAANNNGKKLNASSAPFIPSIPIPLPTQHAQTIHINNLTANLNYHVLAADSPSPVVTTAEGGQASVQPLPIPFTMNGSYSGYVHPFQQNQVFIPMFSTAGGTDAVEKAGRGEPASKESIDLAFGTNPPVVSVKEKLYGEEEQQGRRPPDQPVRQPDSRKSSLSLDNPAGAPTYATPPPLSTGYTENPQASAPVPSQFVPHPFQQPQFQAFGPRPVLQPGSLPPAIPQQPATIQQRRNSQHQYQAHIHPHPLPQQQHQPPPQQQPSLQTQQQQRPFSPPQQPTSHITHQQQLPYPSPQQQQHLPHLPQQQQPRPPQQQQQHHPHHQQQLPHPPQQQQQQQRPHPQQQPHPSQHQQLTHPPQQQHQFHAPQQHQRPHAPQQQQLPHPPQQQQQPHPSQQQQLPHPPQQQQPPHPPQQQQLSHPPQQQQQPHHSQQQQLPYLAPQQQQQPPHNPQQLPHPQQKLPSHPPNQQQKHIPQQKPQATPFPPQIQQQQTAHQQQHFQENRAFSPQQNYPSQPNHQQPEQQQNVTPCPVEASPRVPQPVATKPVPAPTVQQTTADNMPNEEQDLSQHQSELDFGVDEDAVVEPAAVETAPAGPKSWAGLFKASAAANEPAPKTVKPTARISPFTSSEASVATPTASTAVTEVADSKSRELGQFLKDYRLTHFSASLLPCGLVNRSNWCFVNAILQALLACPPLYNLLKNFPLIPGMTRQPLAPMLESLILFSREFAPLQTISAKPLKSKDKGRKKEEIRTGACFEPSYVYKMLLNLSSDTFQVVEGRQEDAEEFLTCLLNGVSDEMLALMKLVQDAGPQDPVEEEPQEDEGDAEDWQEVDSRGKGCVTRRVAGPPDSAPTTPIQAMALGILRSSLKSASGEGSATLQPFFTLPLDIQHPEVNSINGALVKSFDSEDIDGYICQRTKQVVEASRCTSLEELPTILILHIKRFVYDGSSRGVQKVMKPVDFTVDMEIPKSVLSAESRPKFSAKQRLYKLFAVVYHNGREATKGHYVTDVYHTGYGTWLHADDSTITETAEQSVLNPSQSSTPYILFYRRCDTMVGLDRSAEKSK